MKVTFTRVLQSASSLPCIELLYKLRKQRPDVFNKLEGGFDRSSGVLRDADQDVAFQYTSTVASVGVQVRT